MDRQCTKSVQLIFERFPAQMMWILFKTIIIEMFNEIVPPRLTTNLPLLHSSEHWIIVVDLVPDWLFHESQRVDRWLIWILSPIMFTDFYWCRSILNILKHISTFILFPKGFQKHNLLLWWLSTNIFSHGSHRPCTLDSTRPLAWIPNFHPAIWLCCLQPQFPSTTFLVHLLPSLPPSQSTSITPSTLQFTNYV